MGEFCGIKICFSINLLKKKKQLNSRLFFSDLPSSRILVLSEMHSVTQNGSLEA